MQHLEGSGTPVLYIRRTVLNPLNAELNPIYHLLALLGAHHILHICRVRVKGKQNTYVTKILRVEYFKFCCLDFSSRISMRNTDPTKLLLIYHKAVDKLLYFLWEFH